MEEMRARRGERRRVLLLLLSFSLFISSVWIVFDELLMPRAEGARTVTVPDFEGEEIDSIAQQDWLSIETQYRYDEHTPAGVVISQSPTPGSMRKLSEAQPTCKLKLTVSLGVETVRLPSVLGMDVRAAENALRTAGFAVKTEVRASAYPEGEVYDVQPRGEEILPRGTTVTLYASAGAPSVTVTVPDVRGLPRGEALMRLWLAQLSVEEVVETPSDEEDGIVISQNYQPGTVVMAGTRLTLHVSRQWE